MAAKKIHELSTGSITGTDLAFIGDPSTGELTKITYDDIASYVGTGALVYVAIISQSSTSAPTATVVLNTLGETVAFSRNLAGDYNATASGAVFTASKTAVFITNGDITQSIGGKRTSDTVINFVAGGDGNIQNASFKIEVYP